MIPKIGDIFSIDHGPYITKAIVCLNVLGKRYDFLMLFDEFRLVSLVKKDFDYCLDKKFLVLIENLPEEYLNVIKEQYKLEKNKKPIIKNLLKNG